MSKVNRMTRTSQMVTLAALAALVLLLALAPGLADAAPEGWRLQVRRASVTQGDRVLLSEIVRVVGEAPADVVSSLSKVQLWKGPGGIGRQQAVPRKQLVKLLQYYAPELAPACVYPNRLVVQRGGRVFERREIEQAVVEFLTPRLALPGAEVELREYRMPDYIFLPDELGNIEIVAQGDVKPGPVSVILRAKGTDGRISRRVAASLFADVWKTVPCAAKPINRLEEVTPAKVTFMRKNLAYISTPWDGEGGPYRLTRPVGTGQPLLLEGMESVPMVAKGERVDLVFQGRSVRLSIRAVALADAEFGDMVEVRNLQSKRTVLATVMDTSTVVVR